MEGEEHVGDGVYIQFRGFDFRLRTPREGGDHEIFIDLEILAQINKYVERRRNAKR